MPKWPYRFAHVLYERQRFPLTQRAHSQSLCTMGAKTARKRPAAELDLAAKKKHVRELAKHSRWKEVRLCVNKQTVRPSADR